MEHKYSRNLHSSTQYFDRSKTKDCIRFSVFFFVFFFWRRFFPLILKISLQFTKYLNVLRNLEYLFQKIQMSFFFYWPLQDYKVSVTNEVNVRWRPIQHFSAWFKFTKKISLFLRKLLVPPIVSSSHFLSYSSG